MRVVLAAVAILGLAACDPAPTSDAPLVQPGAQLPRAGLWALLAEDCPPPPSPDIRTWPDCSLPVWVRAGEVTFTFPGPISTGMVVSDGVPAVLQLAPSGPWRPPPFMTSITDPPPSRSRTEPRLRDYTYMAVRPEGAAPFVRARVWPVPCPFREDGGLPDLEVTDDTCKVKTEAALRRLVAEAVRGGHPGYEALWVAP